MFYVPVNSLVFYNCEDSFDFFFNLLVVLGNFAFNTFTHHVVKVNNFFQYQSLHFLAVDVKGSKFENRFIEKKFGLITSFNTLVKKLPVEINRKIVLFVMFFKFTEVGIEQTLEFRTCRNNCGQNFHYLTEEACYNFLLFVLEGLFGQENVSSLIRVNRTQIRIICVKTGQIVRLVLKCGKSIAEGL